MCVVCWELYLVQNCVCIMFVCASVCVCVCRCECVSIAKAGRSLVMLCVYHGFCVCDVLCVCMDREPIPHG